VVVGLVVSQALPETHAFKILVPADYRPLVGVLGVGRGEELFQDQPKDCPRSATYAR